MWISIYYFGGLGRRKQNNEDIGMIRVRTDGFIFRLLYTFDTFDALRSSHGHPIKDRHLEDSSPTHHSGSVLWFGAG